MAVSALSMTASVPSCTALATSLTSARVGTGLTIMLSIICVAVMTTLSCTRASLIMRFCSAGTAALPTSTARSPRATMMPSLALRMASSWGMASLRSILAISPGRWRQGSPATLASWRAISMSVALLGKLTARYSHWNDIAVLMSSMSLAVSAGAVSPPPCLLMPLLLASTPPTLTTVCTASPRTVVTSSTSRPSLSSRMSPGRTSRGSSL